MNNQLDKNVQERNIKNKTKNIKLLEKDIKNVNFVIKETDLLLDYDIMIYEITVRNINIFNNKFSYHDCDMSNIYNIIIKCNALHYIQKNKIKQLEFNINLLKNELKEMKDNLQEFNIVYIDVMDELETKNKNYKIKYKQIVKTLDETKTLTNLLENVESQIKKKDEKLSQYRYSNWNLRQKLKECKDSDMNLRQNLEIEYKQKVKKLNNYTYTIYLLNVSCISIVIVLNLMANSVNHKFLAIYLIYVLLIINITQILYL